MKPSHGLPRQAPPVTAVTDDSITVNRGVEVVPASAIPAPPPRFRATDPRTRQRRLRHISDEHLAEAREAASELAARGPALKEDLGRNAPTSAESATILARFDETRAAVARAQALLGYLMELEDIAVSDMATLLDHANALFEANAVHDPALATHFARLARYASLHGRDVADGIARSRDAAPPPPPATAPANDTGPAE